MNSSSETFSLDDFIAYCYQRGFSLTDKQIDQFVRYAFLLQEWNERVNLTAITSLEGILLKHFVDCLELIPVIRHSSAWIEGRTLRMLDFGTGAGFPGLVLKLVMPEVEMTLCDSLRKRTDFLTTVVKQLDVSNVTILHTRAEELAKDRAYRERFSHVVARAVARMPVLIEWAGPFVEIGGSFHAMKGPDPKNEMEESLYVAKKLGFSQFVVTPYVLPLQAGDHTIISLYKDRPTPKVFPRKPGEAQRSPLLTRNHESK